MNEKNISDLLGLLTIMTDEIKALKSWKNEQTQRQAEEDAAQEQSSIEFTNWLNDRKAKEQHEEEQTRLLRDMMV